MQDVKTYMLAIGGKARLASRLIGRADTAAKNLALVNIANRLEADEQALVTENALSLIHI